MRNKYNAKRVNCPVYGKFDSKQEYKRYLQLLLLKKAGEIGEIKRQVPYVLSVNNMKICTYKADFVYMKDGKEVIEDSKGVVTAIFRLKKKLMKALYNIDILVTK